MAINRKAQAVSSKQDLSQLEDSRGVHARASRAYQQKMRDEGCCPVCGVPAKGGTFYCEAHANSRKEARKQREAARTKKGLCLHCDKSVVKGKRRCAEHLEKMREYQRVHKANSRAKKQKQ